MLSPWSQELIGMNTIRRKPRTQFYRLIIIYYTFLCEIQHLRQEYKGDKKRHRGKGWCPPIHAEYEGFMEEESVD